VQKEIDDHQYDHRYAEQPPNKVFAHQPSPFCCDSDDEKTPERCRALRTGNPGPMSWPDARSDPPTFQLSLGIFIY
jgi:hypothetical protein